MSETKIQWTAGADGSPGYTFNPWIGCTKVSPGCAHCYAEAMDGRFGGGHWGPGAPRKRTSPSYWKQPLRWDREAKDAGVRRRVFCASLADVFDPEVPDAWREELFALILLTPHLTWLLLTKRAEFLSEYYTRPDFGCINEAARRLSRRDDIAVLPTQRHGMVEASWPPPNVWLGASVENQEAADQRIPHLLAVPAAVRFLSMEPLLGPVDLSAFIGGPYVALPGDVVEPNYNAGLHWVIVGGESGPKARPFDIAWARSLRDQCRAAGVPVFVKQFGARPMISERREDVAHEFTIPGGRARFAMASYESEQWFELRDRKGGDPSEWPEDLRVREFPEAER